MRLTALLFTTLFATLLAAQSTVVNGCVYDDTGEPLIGASVLVKNTTLGTVTDIYGCFELSVASLDSVDLVVSYTGYTNTDTRVRPGENATIHLKGSETTLDEVIVTGSRARPIRYERTYSMSVAAADDVGGRPAGVSSRSRHAKPGRSATPAGPRHAPGQLTAGETNDFAKWELWTDISQEDLARFRDVWHYYPDRRYAVQLTHPGGRPVIDRPVYLRSAGGEILWSARTDNLGRAELWAGMFDAQGKQPADPILSVPTAAGPLALPAEPFAAGLNTVEIPEDCQVSRAVDVAFVVDATGSMGDELAYLTSELTDVVQRATDSLPAADIRTAAVVYQDHKGSDYLTRHQGFADAAKTTSFLNDQRASGGGDAPEAVDYGLAVALDSLSWREDAAARLLFLVLDAPPHQDTASLARMHRVTVAAARRGVRLVPVVCSGMTKDGEYLLRSLALATNGTYVFLTDHSGIGGKHLEPTTDAYDVETLNDLLVRLIAQFGRTADCQEVVTEANFISSPDAGPQKAKVTAFPNPTAGPLTVCTPRRPGQLLVFDANGKLLRRRTVTGRKHEIDLAGLAAGTYVISYRREGEGGSCRVVLVP